MPELSWQSFAVASDVVRIGEHVACEFLQFDTYNLEARLSLRATQPDPFQTFADQAAPGRKLTGRITKLVPFGAFVHVAEGIEGLVRDLHGGLVGDELVVVIADIDRQRRRIELRVSPPGWSPSGRSCAEPDDEGCGGNGAEEDVAASVIASRDGTELLEPVDGSLDGVALGVALLVEAG